MFHNIPGPIQARMKFLEEVDREDWLDGTTRMRRLRQIPPETGRFLALLLAAAPDGAVLEIGTSAGYSTLWLSLACEQRNKEITTFEILPEKAVLARETFQTAGVSHLVALIEGDGLELLPNYDHISFCFLDAEKEIYEACYDLIVPRLVPGGLLLADNAINHRAALKPLIEKALNDDRVDALVVPIGKGVLLCRAGGW